MDWFTGWWASIDWDAGYWAAVGGLAAALTGVVAIWALVHAARDSRERSRPFVLAEYRIPANAYKRLDFVIRNAGASVARDLEVRFEPSLEPTTNDRSMRTYLIKRYMTRIPSLGPGQELSNVVLVDDEDPLGNDIPSDVVVTVSYTRGWFRRYRDQFRLLTDVYTNHTYATSSDSVLGRLTQIRDELRRIAGGRGGSVFTRDIRDALVEISAKMGDRDSE